MHQFNSQSNVKNITKLPERDALNATAQQAIDTWNTVEPELPPKLKI